MLALKAVVTALFIVVALTLCGAPVYADDAPAPSPAPVLSPAEQEALSQEVTTAFNNAKRSLNLQTEMPVKKEIKVQNLEPNKFMELLARFFVFLADIAVILLIAAIVVIVVIILLNFNANRWSDSRARKLAREDEIEVDTEATVVRMEKAQVEADELARQGNFAEAMHVLLLQSVNELRRRLKVSIAVSLTSREILYRIGLPPEGHNVFADIIRRVEISYFGSYQPDVGDYTACRNSYDTLTNILRKGGAAA